MVPSRLPVKQKISYGPPASLIWPRHFPSIMWMSVIALPVTFEAPRSRPAASSSAAVRLGSGGVAIRPPCRAADEANLEQDSIRDTCSCGIGLLVGQPPSLGDDVMEIKARDRRPRPDGVDVDYPLGPPTLAISLLDPCRDHEHQSGHQATDRDDIRPTSQPLSRDPVKGHETGQTAGPWRCAGSTDGGRSRPCHVSTRRSPPPSPSPSSPRRWPPARSRRERCTSSASWRTEPRTPTRSLPGRSFGRVYASAAGRRA